MKMDPNTILIFSFSGGSTKGYGENRFMQKFLQQWGVPQSKFREYVDCFGGVSIGSITGAGYAYGKTPDELEKFFTEKAKRIFTIRTASELGGDNASLDSNRPNAVQKAVMVALSDPFYKSANTNSNYGDNILHQTLFENFGNSTLGNLKNYFVASAVERLSSRPIYFSNFEDPNFFEGRELSIVDVCRASSAALPYLPSYKIGEQEYIDGAFMINNVVDMAINIGLTAKPNATKIVVISVGAGIGKGGFDSYDDGIADQHMVSKMLEYINLMMVNAEEASRINLQYRADVLNKLYSQSLYFYSFQPKFPKSFANEIDNSTADWFKKLADVIDDHYYMESANISSIISRLPVL